MKKLLLGVLTLLGTFGMAEAANKLMIRNHTNCAFTLSISGADGDHIGPIAEEIFNSYPNVNITAIKIMYVNGSNTTQVNVSISDPYSTSIGQPTPPCIPGAYLTATWSQATPSDDAVLEIYYN